MIKKKIYLKKCEVCGKKFNALNDKQKFCSYVCAYKGRKTTYNKIKINCDFCSKEFLRSPSLLKGYEKKFCSIKCRANYQKKDRLGKKNSNWKGGIYTQKISASKGKGNRLYKKGKYYERKARKELEEIGYYVMTSAGSKGIWDLIAINSCQIRFIQIKSNNLPSPKEREQMANFKCPENSTKEIWRYYGIGKKHLHIYKNGWNIKYEKK